MLRQFVRHLTLNVSLSLLFCHRNNKNIGIKSNMMNSIPIKGYTDNGMFKVLVVTVCLLKIFRTLSETGNFTDTYF